jgi:two-component sensor histidine kinase
MRQRATQPGTTSAPSLTSSCTLSAHASQVGEARRWLARNLGDSQAADDAILCISELVTNTILHSNSRKPGGTFTIRAEVHAGDYLCIDVEDNGGPWEDRAHHRDGRPHGLDIVNALAADWGVDGDPLTGWVVWARLNWPPADRCQPTQGNDNA